MKAGPKTERAARRATVVGPGGGSWFLARLDEGGATLRVDGAVPGERVVVAPRDGVRDGAWADLLEVLSPSPARRTPPCSLAGRCGGCHWQHVDDAEQARLRAVIVEDALAGFGVDLTGVARRHLPARPSMGDRWRARFQTTTDTPGRLVAGFHGLGSRRVVPVERCPLLAPPLQDAYEHVVGLLRGGPDARDVTGLEITALPDAAGALVFLNPRDRSPARWPQLGRRLLENLGGVAAGVAVRDDMLGARTIMGRLPSGAPVAAAARGFLQSQLTMADALADEVARLAVVDAGARVLELYAGSGLLGWRAAARGATVLAVERDPLAVEAGASLPAPPRGRLEWAAPGDAGDVVEGAGRAESWDAVIADPPRSGLGALADDLAALGTSSVVLVSCSARSLARDVAALGRHGYALDELASFDLFPHTRHVESVARLTRA